MYVTVSTRRILLVILGFLFLLLTQAGHHAYGHFFGAIRNVDIFTQVPGGIFELSRQILLPAVILRC